MNNRIKFLILIFILILGIVIYTARTNTQEVPGNNSQYQVPQDEATTTRVLNKNIYESTLGFSIVVPEEWISVDGPNGQFALLLDSNKDGKFEEGRINATPYNGKDIFEISNGKFGKYTLRFSNEDNCWMVGESNAKSPFGESCREPLKYFNSKPIFSVFSENAFVLVNSETSFVYFDSLSGHKEVLKEIIESIR